MTMDREKRETELESAMFTNCLLLGLDPSIIGVGASNGTPRVGVFRHSKRQLGEHLLYFILSSLRGPKDFENVWPIFDPTRSRDFLKVVQSIISELESQGALPRCNSRVSSLATCCGPRFVELLWQLSLHALREGHRRTYAADVVSNPLPASLTDVGFSHAATLLPVTKARIALERRRFLKNCETAVQRQATWSNLAHEMTAEYRSLCAEEAYLQQELEKLHDLRNKVKMEGEPWDELVSSSSQNSHLVQRATRLWDSLLSCKSQHEVLASGPIEDVIAHRVNRYCISGSSLLAAMDESSQVSSGGLDREIDIAQVIRRWTHALQRIHTQSLHLAKANVGEGPDLLRSANDGGTSGHAESLATALAEHRQHLAGIQVLVNQLKGVVPTIQNSISKLSEEVDTISTTLPQMTNNHGGSTSTVQPQSTGRTTESCSDDISSRLSTVSSALKLPPLFSRGPNSSVKSGDFYKRQAEIHRNVSENLPLEQTVSNSQLKTAQADNEENDYVGNMKKSVREVALATRSTKQDDDDYEHFFSGTRSSRVGLKKKQASSRSKQLFASEVNISGGIKYNESLNIPSNLDILSDSDAIDDFMSSNYAESEGRLSFYDQVFFPPFPMEADSFEDLLGKIV